jgi:hypothetical protein
MVLSIELTDANARAHTLAFTALYEAGECCDAEVLIDGEAHPVSRMALGAASAFFKAAFSHALREGRTRSVSIDPSLDATCVKQLLRFAHTATLTVEEPMVESCIRAADQLGFEAIVPELLKGLQDGIDSSNCVGRYVLGRRFRNDGLIDAAAQHFTDDVAGCAESPAFLALSLDQMAHVFSTDMGGARGCFCVCDEVIIYEACMTWYANRCPTERTDETLGRLMSLLHLPCLGAEYICKKVMYSETVLGSPAARLLVEKAVHYLAAPSARAELASPRMLPRASFGGVRVDGYTLFEEHRTDFNDSNLPNNTVVANGGQRLERRGSTCWRGTRSIWSCGCNEMVTLRISDVGPEGEETEYFLGVATGLVPLDVQSDHEDAIGITFKGARVGDQITLLTAMTEDSEPKSTLHFWISLADGRTELEWMENLVGEMDLPQDCSDYHHFVQIKGGSLAHSVAIEIVERQYELPEVEW